MMVVRGTRRFLDRVGPPEAKPAESSGELGDWYANVLFWRPQVALFVNKRSLLPVLVPLAPAASALARFPDVFVEVAARLGVNRVAVDLEVVMMREPVLSKTASRSVLGVMNEFVHLADEDRWRHDTIDLTELSLWLAQVPCSPLFATHGSPDRELRALLT